MHRKVKQLTKLIQAGLFNPGTCLVSGNLVTRYNECLEAIGVPKTKLRKFHIDGIGWSSEIAEEKDDPYYLSSDGSVAIIVSLDQKNSVIYFPFFSFDKRVMRMIFEDASSFTRDILERASIVAHVDKQISGRHLTPHNLLRIDRFSLEFMVTRDLAETSVRQKELVNEFSDGGWFSASVRGALVESAESVGDLRYKNLDIPNMNFLKIDCFYSRAFDGVFVFRSLNGLKPMIVFTEDHDEELGSLPPGSHIFNLHDKPLRDYFIKEGLIGVYDYELSSPKGRKKLYRLRDLMLIDGIIEEAGKDSKSVSLDFLSSDIARKRVADRLFDANLLPKAYYDFGELIHLIEKESPLKRRLEEKTISGYSALLRPNPDLPEHVRNLIWQMIVRKSPFDILRLFIHDREEFYRRFITWSDARQDWAVEYLRKNFEPQQVV